jgi:HSP20 family protein
MTTRNITVEAETKEETPVREQARDVPVFVPAADIYETQQAVVVVADMPGVDEKHVTVTLENDLLTIAGQAVPEQVQDGDVLYQGYVSGDYSRSFKITQGVDRDKIQAQMKNGALRVTLPKAEHLQPRSIAVEAG